jgi:hypothetical protein
MPLLDLMLTNPATPHRGSSYLSMRNLAGSIQKLLHLTVPLPRSITDGLRLAHGPLLHIDEEFKELASDLQIWSFYETVDSRLSGGTGATGREHVYFSAPITSIKSAILGIRQESVFPLHSDHANCASFGRRNTQTLTLFLKDFALHISKADDYAQDRGHTSINLEQKVKVEVHGFYEDPMELGSVDKTVRAWSTKLPLRDFLVKGPDQALEDRLNEVSGEPRESQFLGFRPRAASRHKTGDSIKGGAGPPIGQNLLGIRVSADGRRGSKSDGTEPISATHPMEQAVSPDIVLTDPFNQTGPPRTPTRVTDNELAQIAALSPGQPEPSSLHPQHATKPLPRKVSFPRSASEGAALMATDYFGFSSSSKFGLHRRFSDALGFEDVVEEDENPRTVSAAANRAARRLSETALSQDLQITFSRPDPRSRRFVWIHLPFTNPTWVKRIFERLAVEDKRDFSVLFNRDHWGSKHTRGRHSQHHAYFVKPGCGFIPPKPLSPRPSSPKSSVSSGLDSNMYHYAFLPFLHFDTYRNLIKRREIIKERLKQGRARPVPQHVAQLHSLELQVAWEYLAYDPPVNCRRTLDQFRYPSLHDTRARDDDQMLYKMTKERISPNAIDPSMYHHNHSDGKSMARAYTDQTIADDESVEAEARGEDEDEDEDMTESDSEGDILNGNVLMVDQLWMWTVDASEVAPSRW